MVRNIIAKAKYSKESSRYEKLVKLQKDLNKWQLVESEAREKLKKTAEKGENTYDLSFESKYACLMQEKTENNMLPAILKMAINKFSINITDKNEFRRIAKALVKARRRELKLDLQIARAERLEKKIEFEKEKYPLSPKEKKTMEKGAKAKSERSEIVYEKTYDGINKQYESFFKDLPFMANSEGKMISAYKAFDDVAINILKKVECMAKPRPPISSPNIK